jgi:hypothetical protein
MKSFVLEDGPALLIRFSPYQRGNTEKKLALGTLADDLILHAQA